MNRTECLQRMKAPADKRSDRWHSILQIVVTSACDMACSNCTYLVKHRPTEHITLANFERAVHSLIGYPGIVGLIGGNPCLHPDFPKLCKMLDVIPRQQRGLWSNRLFGHGKVAADTFGFYNLNVHGNQAAAEEIRQDIPWARIYGEDKSSIHGAVMVSMADLVPDESQRYDLIARCDINQKWSAAVVQIDGRLEGYFCELTSSLAAATGRRCGVPIVPGWWDRPMEDFAAQVDMHCHQCGVPLRIRGHHDSAKTDDISRSHRATVARGSAYRSIVEHDQLPVEAAAELTDYQRLRSRRVHCSV